MTFSTETRIITHVADIDIFQVHEIGKFCNEKHLQFGFDFDRQIADRYLYTLSADVTGHSAEFYLLMDEMMK